MTMVLHRKKDHCGTYRFVGRERARRIRNATRRGLPVRLSFVHSADWRESYILCTPRPGFTHMSSRRDVRQCQRKWREYHLTLTLRRLDFSQHHQWQGVWWNALDRIQRALANRPSTTLRVRSVNGIQGVSSGTSGAGGILSDITGEITPDDQR